MSYRQRKSRRRNGHGARSKLLLAFGVVATICVIAVLSLAGYVLAIASTAPDLSELKPVDKGQISVVYAADGSRLGYVQSDILRRVLPGADIPVDLRRATVAIEDERFYKHKGVDLNAIVRAGIKNLESGETVQGGSTITQQLVRALYIKDPKRNFARKIREAKLASELEKEHSKPWILDNYLNSVPYGTVDGRTAIGAEAAAVTFFDKHAKNLDLDESALLAGLTQAPSQYNPFRNPQAAIERRNEVLKKMLDNGYITQAEYQEAAGQGLNLKRGRRYEQRREPYFFDYMQEQLIERYGVGVVRRGGLRIHTTIDPKMQDQAREAINSYYADPAGPSSAIVAVDPANGKIRAMASSGTYGQRRFNLAAQGHRQPGSAFKTFVLTAAIRKGIDPDSTTYTSKPLNIDDPSYGKWEVKTFGNSYIGTVSLTRATLSSDNTVYAQLILDVGPKSVCETAKLLGITTKLDCYPAEGLGGLTRGVTTLEMAGAYATLASGGIRHRPTGIERVVFPDGKSENLASGEGKRVLTDGQAYEVTRVLKMNVQSGTGTAANYGCPAAGKTGTTDEAKDAWFVGYTPHLSAAVWVGYPDAGVAMPGAQGGTYAAPVWHAFMVPAHGEDCDDFPLPDQPAEFHPFFGKYASTGKPVTPPYSEQDGTTTDQTGGTGTDQQFDPRYYEQAPQNPPDAQAPPAPPADGAPQGQDQQGGGAPGAQ
ncbi:MAG: penicillin-binding protein [Thermoleophilaceae bacterium]|jgi:penicillin-binding protein 1A|nr:penicillin-binding protein [Thermoleophilaceae bacterium]